MTLNNLVGINLEKIPVNLDAIKRLITAAERNIADSKIAAVSAENRFDAAYKAIRSITTMILDYFLLSRRFSKFAEQAEWVGDILFDHNNSSSLPIHDSIVRYTDYRASIPYKLLAFKNETKSFFGWLKSFTPRTIAFRARNEIANQLIDAEDLYLRISIEYGKNINQPQKPKNNIPKNTKETRLKNDTVKPILNPQHFFIQPWRNEKNEPAFNTRNYRR